MAIVLLVLFSHLSGEQSLVAGDWAWANSLGSSGDDTGTGIAVDDIGHVYITGEYEHTPDGAVFEGGGNRIQLENAGFDDLYFAKYREDGALVWAKRAGTTGLEVSHDIAVDPAGRFLIVVGALSRTITLGTGASQVTIESRGFSDALVAKFDSEGNVLWARGSGGDMTDAAHGVDLDGDGNVYVVGPFSNAVRFGEGEREVIFSSQGNTDIFLAKYSPDGELLWVRSAGSRGEDWANAVSVTPENGVFVGGFVSDDITFGEGANESFHDVPGRNNRHSFLANYDTDGEFRWSRIHSGDRSNEVSALAAEDGVVCIGGNFLETFNSGTERNAFSLRSRGGRDGFLVCYDTKGQHLWTEHIGGDDSDQVASIEFDEDGRVIVGGRFGDRTQFGKGDQAFWTEADTANPEAYVARYSENGEFEMLRITGHGPATEEFRFTDDKITGVAPLPDGSIAVLGLSKGIPVFSGKDTQFRVRDHGQPNVFLAKLGTVGNERSPVILRHPISGGHLAGTDLTLSVLAFGDRPFRYQWFKDGNPIGGRNERRFSLENLKQNDAADYTVKVTNALGETLSFPAVIEVPVPPVIITQPTDLRAPLGTVVLLSVDVQGDEPLEYQWFFEETKVIGATDSRLEIPQFREGHSGRYRVEINNPFGSVISQTVRLEPRLAGALEWRQAYTAPLTPPSIDLNGNLYFTEGQTRIRSLDSEGRPRWTAELITPGDTFLGQTVFRQDHEIYLAADTTDRDDVLYSFDQSTGRQRLRVRLLGGQVAMSPTVGRNGTIYLAFENGFVDGFSSNGKPIWRFPAGEPPAFPVVLGSNQQVYIGTTSGKLFCVDADGNLTWELTTKANWIPGPAIGLDGALYLADQQGQLFAVDEQGKIRWIFRPDDSFLPTPPVIAPDGTLYVGSRSGQVYALDPHGQIRWTHEVGTPIESSPTIAADGTIQVFDSQGTLITLDPNGIRLSTEHLNKEVLGTPVLSPSGRYYFATMDHTIYAANGTAGPASEPWPMFYHDSQRTGQGEEQPTVTLQQPIEGTQFEGKNEVPFTIEASSPHGPIVRIDYLVDSVIVSTANEPPFASSWHPLKGGHFKIQARAIDSLGASRLSESVTIEVIVPEGPPRFLTQPEDAEAVNGETVLLEADVTGERPLMFQWFKDGIPLEDKTESTLSLSQVDVSDSARYWLRVINATGLLDSNTIVVTVRQPFDVLWEIPWGDIPNSIGITPSSSLLLPTSRAGVISIDPAGMFEWGFSVPNRTGLPFSPVIAADGSIYVGGDGGSRMHALSANGSPLWSFMTDGGHSGPALSRDGTIYLSTSRHQNRQLHALSPAGRRLWSVALDGEAIGSPVVTGNGDIIVGTADPGRIHRIRPGPNTGRRLWDFDSQGDVRASAAIGQDDTIYAGDSEGIFYALRPEGSLAWYFDAKGPIFAGSAIGLHREIYVVCYGVFDPIRGTERGTIYALAPDGTVLWQFTAGAHIISTPAVAADGTLYFGSKDTQFYALNPNGTIRWQLDTGSPLDSSPTIGADGVIYFGTPSKVIAVQGTAPLANTPWPMAQHDPRHTGNVGLEVPAASRVIQLGSNQFDDQVHAMARLGEIIYVGGEFRLAGGVEANRVARWDGQLWHPMGDGFDRVVRGLVTTTSGIIAVGDFTKTGATPVKHIARWNDSSWQSLGDGLSNRAYDVAEFNKQILVAGSEFTPISPVTPDTNDWTQPQALLEWNGQRWQPFGPGLQGSAKVLHEGGGSLFVGGQFLESAGRSLD